MACVGSGEWQGEAGGKGEEAGELEQEWQNNVAEQ